MWHVLLSFSLSLPPLPWVMACESSIKQILHTLIVPKVSSRFSRACLSLPLPLFPNWPLAGPPNKLIQCWKFSFVMVSPTAARHCVYLIFCNSWTTRDFSGPVGVDYDIRLFGDSLSLQCHVWRSMCASQPTQRGQWQEREGGEAVCLKLLLLLNAATFVGGPLN